MSLLFCQFLDSKSVHNQKCSEPARSEGKVIWLINNWQFPFSLGTSIRWLWFILGTHSQSDWMTETLLHWICAHQNKELHSFKSQQVRIKDTKQTLDRVANKNWGFPLTFSPVWINPSSPLGGIPSLEQERKPIRVWGLLVGAHSFVQRWSEFLLELEVTSFKSRRIEKRQLSANIS